MRKKTTLELGQAIPLFALALVGLIGFTALAIDGGLTYSDRRQAQNAADAAALAGAYVKVKENDWSAAALGRASDNGFDDNDSGDNSGQDIDVEVYNPPISGPYAGDDEYIQVIIDSQVETSLIHFVYTGDVVNTVEAVARAKPYSEMYFGNAIVALQCTGDKAIWLSDGPDVTATGGGMFSNSVTDGGYTEGGNPSGSVPSITTVSTPSFSSDLTSTINTGASQFDCSPPEYMLPEYTCDYDHGDFQVKSDLELPEGVHCFDRLRINAKANLTGSEVTLVVETDVLHINGGADINISSPSSGPTAGLLIYIPPSNSSDVTMNGNSDQRFTGTIFGPSSHFKLTGTAGEDAFNSQLIGHHITFSGDFEGKIHYDDGLNYDGPPIIEITQ